MFITKTTIVTVLPSS